MNISTILNILIVVVSVVAIAFIYLAGRRKHRSRLVFGSASNDGSQSTEVTINNDIRSRTIKCNRCGRRAYGILGTSDVYRCQSCGHNTRKESESGAYSERNVV